MLRSLMTGWRSEEDVQAAITILRSMTSSERGAVQSQHFNDLFLSLGMGPRTRIRIELAR
jgi:hypothetical protein